MVPLYSQRAWRSAAMLFSLLLVGTLAVAQTVWTGATSTDWFDATNWSNGLPAAGNDAVVPTGASVTIDEALDARFEIASFGTIVATAPIQIRQSLSNSGTLTTSARINTFGSFENFGDLELDTTASLYTAPTGTTRSNGSILNEGWIGSKGAFINEGVIDVTADGGLAIYETGTFSNPGVVNLAGFYNNRTGGNYSSPSGGTINVEDGGRLSNYDGATLRNAGIINVEEGGRFLQKARLINVPGRIFVDGTFQTYEGSTTLSNFLTIRPTGRLAATAADTFEVVFSLVNEGRATIGVETQVNGVVENRAGAALRVLGTGGLDFIAGTNFSNAGTVLNDGLIRSVGTLTNDGTFTNDGTIVQNNGGTIANNSLFTNRALIENVNRIINNDRFFNESRITNNSGGTIENNALLENRVDAHIENLFEIYNEADLINRGYFENGVSVFNEANFENYGFLSNVGDIFNNPSGIFTNATSGVVDNSGAGIFTNEGLVLNEGEINNFSCGIFVNNARVENNSWITNDGIYYENGVTNNKAIMGSGPVVPQGGSSPLICQPYTQKVDQNGSTIVSGTRFASARFDSCAALTYLIDGVESRTFTCDDIGTFDVTLTLVDRRGNEINCATQLTITDEFAPRIDECPGDIALDDVEASELPIAATWTPPTFTDNCDDDLTIVASNQPGDLFPEGSTVVSYVATDDSGNEFVCEFTVTVTKKAVCAPKDHDGLLAYYNLINGSSKYVTDRAGYGEPLHMEIKNQQGVTWLPNSCGLKNTANNGIVKSYGGARQIGRGIQMTNAFTLETWVRAANTHQSGPARIVTFSENVSARNFTLGQKDNKFVFRLKTTHTNGNGTPDRESRAGAVKPGRDQHVVFTRSANGQERLYIDGELQYSGQVGGNLSNWGVHCSLAFFNEMTLDRPWKGDLKKVAIYDRAWSQAEVDANRRRGACGCDDSPRGNVCEGERGQVTYERFDNIDGRDLSWLYKAAKFPKQPDATRKLTKLEIPTNRGDNYGTRVRGFIYPEITGDYQFAVSGDDQVRLLLSRVPNNPSGAYLVAYHNEWTHPGELHKYPTQKSGVFHLQAGAGYYFEFFQKEGTGGDNGAVYWKRPGTSNFAVIGARYLGDAESCSDQDAGSDCVSERGGLLREVWNGIESHDIWAVMNDPRYPNNPDSRGLISSFKGPRHVADNYSTRVRGYIVPDVTGEYRFTVTGDNQTKLKLSTDASADNAAVIAGLDGWTGVNEFNKFPSQNSAAVRLVAGRRYYVELLHAERTGGDHFTVFWRTPTNATRAVVPGSNLEPYVDCDGGEQPAACNKSVLFVVGNPTLNNGDAAVKHRLQQLGYTVMVKDPQWATAAMAADKGLVIISSTVNSTHLGAKFRDVATPVMTWESYLYDDMRMTGNVAGTDYGASHTSRAVVLGASDQLAAGRSGTQEVLTSNADQRFGKVMGSEARVITHAPADPWLVTVFAYDKGAQMAGGMRAPGIRIGFYLDNEAAARWTSYGRDLFDAAVLYATSCTGGQAKLVTPDVLTLEAEQRLSDVDLTWTANTAFKTDYFLVERSADDVNYYVIDEVDVTATGDQYVNYAYTDADPAEGENYYRVTAVYTDGTDMQSELRLVQFGTYGQVSMFPNPASEDVTVSLEGFEGKETSLIVTDALGRTVSTRKVDGDAAQTTFSVRDLPAGWYGVTLRTGDYHATKALLVQHD